MSPGTLSWAGKSTAASMSSRHRYEPRRVAATSTLVAMASRDVVPVALPREFAGGRSSELLQELLERLVELSAYQHDWDSYGGLPLQWSVVDPLTELVVQLHEYMQTSPTVSLTGDGGLLLNWESPEAELDLTILPGDPASVATYYRDSSGTDREAPARECRDLDKWLWAASAAV